MESEVKSILDILNVNKASGPDKINNSMLKCTSTSVSKPLCILQNRSQSKGSISGAMETFSSCANL